MKLKCVADYRYEHELTEGKEYDVTFNAGIFPDRPFAEGVGDNGRNFECHYWKFDIELKEVLKNLAQGVEHE